MVYKFFDKKYRDTTLHAKPKFFEDQQLTTVLQKPITRKFQRRNPAGKYWSLRRPEDIPLQGPQDVP